MIQINDFDLPIQVAEKIIGGTKEKTGETVINRDMFDLEEIKEIAGYLTVYYDTHSLARNL